MSLAPGSFTQFNYVTHDCEALARRWVESVGAGPFFFWELDDPGLTPTRTYRGQPAGDTFKACYGFIGASMLEFMQPTNDAPSLLREVLDVQGEALQHIFPAIRPRSPEAFDAQHEAYVAAGCPCVADGAAPLFGRAHFYDGRASIGAFIEMVELLPPSYGIIERMHEAHAGWDGARPIRDLTEVIEAVLGATPAAQAAEDFYRPMAGA